MLQPYRFRPLLGWYTVLGLLLLLSALPARAQSGPYGNEWIVPTQQYYKMKVTRDGIHRLSYQYLTQAGLTNVAPSRLQLWRRGRQVAMYASGNQAVLDATTYLEFYGEHNDGQLDRGMYKQAADQPHALYSLYTDTAAYFLTWSATAQGKRMAESNQVGAGAAQANRTQSRLLVLSYLYADVTLDSYIYQGWAEPQESFSSFNFGVGAAPNVFMDSVRAMTTTGQNPSVEVFVSGATVAAHATQVSVLAPGGKRVLEVIRYTGFVGLKRTYPLLRSDVAANGQVTIQFEALNPTPTGGSPDQYRIAYIRLKFPQANRWPRNQRSVAFTNDSTLSGAPYFLLDTIPATARGYDITDPYNVQRIAGQPVGATQRGYVFPAANGRTRQLLIADDTRSFVPLPARPVRFRSFTPGGANFLIVSSSVLMKPAGAVTNPVRAYADYRASTAGGKYDTLVVTSEQLYNQFHYGEKSALAIRQFARWMLTDSRPKNLLLLGKGLPTGEYQRINGANIYHRFEPLRLISQDLVPTSTRGASDTFFTADWQNDSYFARMPTGRIAAQSPLDVLNYLNKLREHEALGPEAWRKNALHLAGGANADQFVQFQDYLNGYKRRIEQPLFGGRVVKTYTRSTLGGNTSFPVAINIASELNTGLSVITYFGHGSLFDFDLNVGNINDPTNNYNNRAKYPVMLFFGCAAGNAFTPGTADLALATQWTLAADKGLVGFLGESTYGFDGILNNYSDLLHKLLFNDPTWYGQPVAAVQNEVARQLTPVYQYSSAGINTLMTTIWQGDPALKLYAPAKPDFVTADSLLRIVPIGSDPIKASTPSFNLLVKVKNQGKITYDSVRISVTRQYPSASGRANDVITPKAFRQAWKDTTYTIEIQNSGNVFGDNRFQVALDYKNEVEELSELNNTGRIDFNFLDGGVTLLNPPEFALVAPGNVQLVGQTNDLAGQERGFDLELDTIPTFNSPLVRRTVVRGSLVADWRPTLPVIADRDSVVWYWRMRFQSPQADEIPDWATSSFRVVGNTGGGWSQSHHGQFRRDMRTGVEVGVPSGNWEFSDVRQGLTMRTQGGGAGPAATFQISYGIAVDNTSSPYVGNCVPNQPNMLLVVFDGRTFKRLTTIGGGTYSVCGQGEQTFYHFAASNTDNINSAARQTQLLTFLNNVPAGAYVAMVSMNKVNFSSFPPELKAAITGLGSRLITQLQDSDPFVLLGQKGPNARAVQELSYDAASATPRADQIIVLGAQLQTRAGNGRIASTRIGPAQAWTTLYHTVRTEPSDSYTLRLIGVDATGNETELNPAVTNRALSLADVSAQQYPYLQLVLEAQDTLNRTAPQLEQWLVTYQGLPEGVVRRDLATPATAYDAATLLAQATGTGYLTFPVTFQNVSALDFGTPLKARITLRDGKNTVRTADIDAPAPLKGSSSVVFPMKLDVRGLTGTITGQVDVNPRLLPELNYFNNQLTLTPFTVPDTSVPPVLDVAFDGMHILNGDIVSPSPVITVQLQDNNKLIPIKSASNFSLFLTRPGQTTPVAINTLSSDMVFSADSAKGVARLEYQPGKATALTDGVYTLEAQARGATNLAAGTENYKITFEVVNASTITNLFPYPNPVTSKARFVFTLTGSELPRNMKLQIMTLTGKVVREVLMAEMGALHIGNNITDFAWDGTDTYGDRLANGTYLYRVVMDDPQNQFSKRSTAADQAFKKGWGKLVLLR